MNAKYSFSRYVIATLAVAAVLVLPTACKDDLGYQGIEGQQIAFKLTAPDAWHDGMPINENAPTTHCTSVRALSGGDTKLYLHTVVADNPAEEKVVESRGTLVTTEDAFKTKYKQFSLSGICYTGGYPDEEEGAENDWTANYAYNLHYTTSGIPVSDSDKLLWPTEGQVRFYAFAPTMEDFNDLKTGGMLTLSEATDKGSPTLTYTVPKDVTKQVDLMTVCKPVNAVPTGGVELNFGHALTAVQIKCGKDMLAGTITEVTIAGVYGKGKQVIGSDKWTPFEDTKATYTISGLKKELPAGDDKIHVSDVTQIVGTDNDNLTFMLLPQTLPEGATMTIKFTDKATNTEQRTLTGSLAGHEWEAGKIVTYSISPSSIHISASVEISKKGATAENPDGDVMPYSGVWYDVKYNPAKVEIVQAGVDTKQIATIPIDKINFQYQLDGSEEWKDCTTDADGLLQIAPQPAYATMSSGFKTEGEVEEVGSESSPVPLTVNGKTANCYLVDKAGYFSLPLVYGNGNVDVPAAPTKSLKYYVDHNDQKISNATITGAGDAVLCWQDAPDLIDPASVKVEKTNLVFHIRKQTITQGNALLAVRNSLKEIIWSWHIWVTPYKKDFYTQFYKSQPDDTYSYDLAQYNLGWCDKHDHNESRTFSLRAVVDMSAYGGKKETSVEIGTFTQDVFKGSDAGDNTYYQWGRKDPMLGGIYNNNTTCYTYTKKNKDLDKNEFTMENKQVFNQYNEGGYNYSFCKNPGDMIESYGPIGSAGEASKGVTIGYAIKHPYMFITNSSEHETDGGFSYRNHWHIPYADFAVPYLDEATHIMFNAWNSTATDAGYTYPTSSANLEHNAAIVKKTVYDPCPPEFQVPPIHALKGVCDKMPSSASYDKDKNAWTIESDGDLITFPMTGVRNYALRSNEWETVALTGSGLTHDEFYKISMPAFRMLTFVSSATIVKKEVYNAYQVYIYVIDRDKRENPAGTNNLKNYLTPSSNSYGLAVRPMHYKPSE